jgi:predicted O-methyltransferase YrrM
MSPFRKIAASAVWALSRPFLVHRAVRDLRREVLKEHSLSEWFDFAYSFQDRFLFARRRISIAPSQVKSEFLQLLENIRTLQPRRILEIGTANGGTIFLLARAALPDATMVTVDLPAEGQPRGYPSWKEPIFRAFAGSKQKLGLIRGDSHDPGTVERVKVALGYEFVDFLFIDADHSYDGVKKDFELYLPLVRPGGLVAFHDIIPDHFSRYAQKTRSNTGEVHRLWEELKGRRPTREIVEDLDQDGFGLGLLTAGEGEAPT